MIIKFTNQNTCDDVNRCVDDLEFCGAEVHATSFFHEDHYCDIEVIISNESAFRPLFEQTVSYLQSNY